MKSVLVLIFLSLACVACNSSETATEEQQLAYACPMHCEGDKTYAEAGKCPVCNMDLEELGAEEETHDDIHPEH